ncbi:reverse transcriptase domain-containing protein [Tanacetum coccineum]
MAEPILFDNMEKALTESNLSITSNDINIELSKEFLVELRKNIYHETYNEDVVDHIAKISKGDGKVTTWDELIEKFFCRFYLESYDREDEMLDEGENWGIDPLEFLSNVNTSFKNHKKVDGRTQKVIFHSWMNGKWNKRYVDNASVSVMPLLTYLNLGLGELAHTRLTVKLVDRTVIYPKGISENVLVGIGKFTFPVDFIILDMTEDIKVPLILGRPFLSTVRAKIDVYKRKITLRVGEEKIVFISVNPTSSLIKRVYMLSLRERMELDLEARLMGETLVNQGDDLMPTIEEGAVIEEFRTKDGDLDTGIDDYPRALMNVPIFVVTFSVVTDFVVLEDMDAYRDEGMGDVIVGEPFLREVGIKARRFDGIITIYNGDDEVTYQMVRSHPRFKRHTNEQCNKILPLLKVSEKDEKNGISHAYQKLKGFKKGVLNL